MWVLFDGPAASGYESLDFLSRESPVVPLTDAKPVRDLFRELLTVIRSGDPHYEVAAGVQVHRLIAAVQASGPGLAGSRAVRELDDRVGEGADGIGHQAGQLDSPHEGSPRGSRMRIMSGLG